MVHDADDPSAVARPWPADAEPVRFPELLAASPRLLSGEAVRPCAGEPLGDLPVRLRAALVRAELPEAERLYVDAIERASCDSGLTSEMLGQLGFLGGLVASTRGDRAEAVARYARAKSWAPGLDWSEDWPARLRVHFDEASPAPGSVKLTVRPSGGLVVDGRPVTGAAQVNPGPHVVRFGDFGAWIEVPPVDDALVVPSAFPLEALGWMGEGEDRRADLTALLAAGLGEGLRAVVTDGAVTWAGTTGRTDWIETGRIAPTVVEPVPASVPPRTTASRPRVGPVMLVAGGVTAVVGGALAGQSWSAAEKNRVDRGDWTVDQHNRAKGRYHAGWAVGGVGVAVLGTGAAITAAGSF